METAICAISKNENAYINDWVNYHLALGFDKIYLYDNNNSDTPFVGGFIEQKDRVEIIDWHSCEDHFANQIEAYKNFIMDYAQAFDWCAIIDVDEFICLNTNNIKDFLSKAPDNSNIVLNWRVYGDDDIIVGDESKPVYERFKQPKFTNLYGVYKSIVSFKNNPNYTAFSPHHFCDDDLKVPCRNCNFESAEYEPDFLCGSYNDLMKMPCYIAHYQTKSLSEFIKYKLNRACGYKTDFRYYFQINDRTPEKLEYIKDVLGAEYDV